MPSRRKFILSSVLAVSGAVAGVYYYKLNSESKEEQAVHEVINKLAGLPGAVRFGEILVKQAQGTSFKELLKSISAHLQKEYGEFNHENIGVVLEHQIQIEFQENQFQIVDGWYLSKTEAELCLLASMVAEGVAV